MTLAALHSPDDHALRDAWEAMRHRTCLRHWPQDFDAVMADPTRGRLVRLEARARTRSQRAAPARAANRPAPRTQRPMPGCGVDRKRAAAGERDDD